MAGLNIFLCLVVVMVMMEIFIVRAQNSRADMPPALDPGYNAHQETLIYACMGVGAALLTLLCLLLWFIVDRSKREVRDLKTVLPAIVDKMRARAETKDDAEDSHGTMRATEFEAGFMTSSSVADNTLDYLHISNDRKRHARAQRHHAAGGVIANERLTNPAASSGQLRGGATNQQEGGTVETNQIVGTRDMVEANTRPANRKYGLTHAAEITANQDQSLQTFHQSPAVPPSSRSRVPGQSPRTEGIVLRPEFRPHPSYAYDNPDMVIVDGSALHNGPAMSQESAGNKSKMKYRNSYYESHV